MDREFLIESMFLPLNKKKELFEKLIFENMKLKKELMNFGMELNSLRRMNSK